MICTVEIKENYSNRIIIPKELIKEAHLKKGDFLYYDITADKGVIYVEAVTKPEVNYKPIPKKK